MVGAHLVGNGIQGPDIWRDFGAEAITVDEKSPSSGIRSMQKPVGWTLGVPMSRAMGIYPRHSCLV